MKLTMTERYAIQNLLPVKEDFLTLKIIRDLKERLSPSEKELKDYGIKQIGNQLVYDNKKIDLKTAEFEIEIGEILINIIRTILKDKNKNKQLHDTEYTIYEKLVINQEG